VEQGLRNSAENYAFLGYIAYGFSEVLEALAEHIDTYEELIPHVFMSECVDLFVHRMIEYGSNDAVLIAVLELVENAYRRKFASNLISVSFIENLPLNSEPGAELKNLLGPTLTSEYQLQRPGDGY
jgi:hypothetical protein